ncbi:MAG: hypothetical protein QHI38_05155 [Armatimonadota bacterium]|nr:hypothetical protein [Armatimonadota bacterium]
MRTRCLWDIAMWLGNGFRLLAARHWSGRTIAVAFLLCAAGSAFSQSSQQFTCQSWHGLSGLFVVPTARVIGKGKSAVSYSESKHVEIFSYSRFMDRQIRAPITYGLSERFEVCAQYQSNQYDVSLQPALENDDLAVFSAKLLIRPETSTGPAIALAVRDIANSDCDAEPLNNVHNGRKFFLLASKRFTRSGATGTFVDAHFGLSHSSRSHLAAMFGVEIALFQAASFIAEGMWDSPFVNFREAYVNSARRGTGDHKGRFIFDTGLRFYPEVVPGLVIDLGVVGDGTMEYSFGVGYVSR